MPLPNLDWWPQLGMIFFWTVPGALCGEIAGACSIDRAFLSPSSPFALLNPCRGRGFFLKTMGLFMPEVFVMN